MRDLTHLVAVRSAASFRGKAPAVRAGVYFVAGDIGPVVATWAVNSHAFESGTGLILAADREARSVSPKRWVLPPRVLASRFGITARTDGWASARNCANPTR